MPSRPGTSGRLFGGWGHAGINIRMIAQGSEELDIVVGVDVDDFERAIRVIYGARLSIATITSLLSRKPKGGDQ